MKKANRIVNVGIAGLGRSGWNIHAPLLKPLKSKYRIVAVTDKNPLRRREAEAQLGCKAYASYSQLLRDETIELLVVATPSHLHTRNAIEAMRVGKHVVCEKPMATSLQDANRMLACARRTGRILAVFQNRRYDRDFLQIMRIIKSGVLGRIVHARIAYHGFGRRWDWQTLKRYGGGNLNNNGAHALDQALVLFGPEKPNVFCVRDRTLTLGDADDHVKIALHRKGSPTVEVEVTSCCAYGQDRWLIMGTRGGLRGNEGELHWKVFNPRKLSKRVLDTTPTPDRSYNADDIPLTEKHWRAEDDTSPGQSAFYPDLYRSIRAGAPLHIKPEEVRRQIWVMDQCRKMAPL